MGPKAVCPKQGKEVTFGADVVEGHSCPIQVALTGYLVDVASFDGDLDPETHDLKAACPDPMRLSRVVENGAGIKLNLSTPRRIDRASLDVIDAT